MTKSFFMLLILSLACLQSYNSARTTKQNQSPNQVVTRQRKNQQRGNKNEQGQQVEETKKNQKSKRKKAKDNDSSYETIDEEEDVKPKGAAKVKKYISKAKKSQKNMKNNKININDESILSKLNQLKSFDSIKYLNVGQGNGIIAKSKDGIFVFDLGTTSKMYLQEVIDHDDSPENIHEKIMKEVGSKKVQFFLTHNDLDHYSMKSLVQIKNFHVSPFVKVRQPIIHPKLEIVKPETIYYDRVLVLNSPNIEHGTTNDNSVIYVIKVQNKVFLLTGDATARTIGMNKTCQEINNSETQHEAKVLQALREIAPHINYFTYPHHGTQTDGSYCVFEEIAKLHKNLDGVIISAGVQRIYKHPSQDSIERVKHYFENMNKKTRSKNYLRFQYFQRPTSQYIKDSDNFKHVLNKDSSNILLGYTNLPLYITASLGDIVYDKKGLNYSFKYDCQKQWELVQYENIDILNSSQKINKKVLSQLQKNVCGYIKCYSSMYLMTNYTVLNKESEHGFTYKGNDQQIREQYYQHEQMCDAKNNRILL